MSNTIRQLNKLFVGNLPWTVSHNELKKYFSEFGHIASATVMFDKTTGLSKGFGFVTFQSKDSVDKALNTESHVLEGVRLNVQPSDSHFRVLYFENYFKIHLCVMEEKFNKACDFLPSLVKKLDSSMLLKFYSFYKQATVGPCNIEKPSWYNMEAKSKYNAWKNLGEMAKPEAMSEYIGLLSEIMPDWEEEDKEINWDESEDSKMKTAEHGGNHTKGWVNVSSMMQVEPPLGIEDKNIFEWAKEGNLIMMTKELAKFEYFNINVLDENGLNCLHWACDRGHLDVVKYLIEECGADVNYKDSEGDGGLDYATAIEHADLIEYLKQAGSKKNS